MSSLTLPFQGGCITVRKVSHKIDKTRLVIAISKTDMTSARYPGVVGYIDHCFHQQRKPMSTGSVPRYVDSGICTRMTDPMVQSADLQRATRPGVLLSVAVFSRTSCGTYSKTSNHVLIIESSSRRMWESSPKACSRRIETFQEGSGP